ncbi:MAG: 3-oxoacyl-ACP reductase FabG [Candidatus Bipolaricaulis sp.]|nr:3-oxoacyl-ACP reductase FabG [Candidatus Bipolaricaulis sp.]
MSRENSRPGALVTGSSRGIGAAIARRLATMGYGVCINYVTSEDAASREVEAIERTGGRAIAVRADVGSFSAVEAMVQRTADAFGGLRVVVNNAGLSEHATVEGMTVDAWNRAVAVNLSSAFYAVKAALPYLRNEPWGRIINIASLRAMTGSDHGAHYAAAKAGLIGLTKSLALELAPAVTVNAVSPGYTRTDMTKDSLARHGDAILARIPARRAAEPEEIAALVAFLASDEAAYITGETINANGGIYMG